MTHGVQFQAYDGTWHFFKFNWHNEEAAARYAARVNNEGGMDARVAVKR
jgi:hypothetical protein